MAEQKEQIKKCPFMNVPIMTKNNISGQVVPTIIASDCMKELCGVYNQEKKKCGHIKD